MPATYMPSAGTKVGWHLLTGLTPPPHLGKIAIVALILMVVCGYLFEILSTSAAGLFHLSHGC